jgi:uncharacterized protein YozE (UPF0346 family)
MGSASSSPFLANFVVYHYLWESPDWAQATMEQVFWDMSHEIDCYIDNMSIFDRLWDTYVPKLNQVLGHLHSNGFYVKPLKCEWGVKETNFLGYWMTPTGLKPWLKQIEPILALTKLETLNQLGGFIGMVNFYRSIWRHCAHVMASSTKLVKVECNQFKQHWGPKQDNAFEALKALITQDILLCYPDPNIPFDKTHASDYQLGTIIKQANKTWAFYSR